jgi:hypothetical protein
MFVLQIRVILLHGQPAPYFLLQLAFLCHLRAYGPPIFTLFAGEDNASLYFKVRARFCRLPVSLAAVPSIFKEWLFLVAMS